MALEDPVMLDKITLTRLVPRTCALHCGKTITSSSKVKESSKGRSI